MKRPSVWIVVLLSLYAAALGWEAWHLGITFDEPSHLAAGYAYWQGHDVLSPSDTPPLMRMLGGWIPQLLGVRMRRDTEGWRRQSSFDIGSEMVEALGADRVRSVFFLTRLPFVGLTVLTIWVLWHWARQLFGAMTALVLSACAMLEPTLTGHGPLIKSDVAAALGSLLFYYAAWRYWRQPDLSRVAQMSVALLVAVLAKFTLLALIPIALALVLWRKPRVAGSAIVLAVTYLGLLAGYQFRDVRRIQKQEQEQWRAEGFGPRAIKLIRAVGRVPWPRQFLEGIRYIGGKDRNEGFSSYMLGRRIEYSAPWYFPLAWAIKFPIPLQLMAVAGVAALVARLASREAGSADAFVWGPAAWIMLLGIRSNIHIGFRHVMPALPFFILGAGFAFQRWGARPVVRAAFAAAVVWLGVTAVRIYPQGISYFNEWIGGPKNGWKYLADSNLDWGQNLPELADFVRRNHLRQVKLFYFGTDVPWFHLPSETIDLQAAPWGPEWEKETRLQPKPGIYAISVNTLLGYFFSPDYRDYFAWFKAREPDARAGESIFIYQVK